MLSFLWCLFQYLMTSTGRFFFSWSYYYRSTDVTHTRWCIVQCLILTYVTKHEFRIVTVLALTHITSYDPTIFLYFTLSTIDKMSSHLKQIILKQHINSTNTFLKQNVIQGYVGYFIMTCLPLTNDSSHVTIVNPAWQHVWLNPTIDLL